MDTTVLPGLWSLAPIPALIGVVILVYWLIVSGRLIPRSSHERELAAAEKRNVDAVKRGDEWKGTALELQKVNTEIRKQNGQLIQANQVVEAFLNASRPPGDTLRPGGA